MSIFVLFLIYYLCGKQGILGTFRISPLLALAFKSACCHGKYLFKFRAGNEGIMCFIYCAKTLKGPKLDLSNSNVDCVLFLVKIKVQTSGSAAVAPEIT